MRKLLSKIKSLRKAKSRSERPGASFVFLFCAILILSATISASLTASRYVATVNATFDDNGVIKDYMDFTVNTVFVVKDQSELFSAINQGYSYIQISNELTNPFVITQSPKNLTTDLIIDLNGIELYRHGTEPIFEISEGVRLTITDTSDSQKGCLYNPTGSVLRIDGGNLTVVSGKFECGPRYSEYYSYNHNILSEKSQKRTIVEDNSYLVDIWIKDENSNDFSYEKIYAPIIKAYDTDADGFKHHHGNVYFDWTVSATPSGGENLDNFTIFADTYCYYTTEEDNSYDIMKSTAYKADWYYTYHVDDVSYRYVANPSEEDIEVTIYGYEETIKNAEENRGSPDDIDKEKNDFFAAIKMTGGVFDILYGDFYNYFGVNTTACIDMMGGELIIKKGRFSTRIPNANYHDHHVIDAKEIDEEAFEPFDYFNYFFWGREDLGPDDTEMDYNVYKEGIRAMKGQGYGILTSGDAKITIAEGSFYSSNNNLIHMQKGSLEIGGGEFFKVCTPRYFLKEYDHTDSAILMHDGNLKIGAADYTIYGDYARAINMQNGKLDINGASCVVHGDYSYAVYSEVPGENLILTDIKFNMHERSEIGTLVGIYSKRNEATGNSGVVTIKTTSPGESYVNIQGNNSAAVYAHGGDVNSQGCNYQIDGYNSAGVYVNEGAVTVNGGHIDLVSNINCYGVYAINLSEEKNVRVDVTNAHIDVGYVDSATPPTTTHSDCRACIGVFLGSANPDSSVILTNSNVHSYEIGVALSGGKLVIADSDSTPNNIKTNRASAVAVSNGNLEFAAGGIYNLTSFNTTSSDWQNTYEMEVPYISQEGGNYERTFVTFNNFDGVYVKGGSVIADGTVNITHTGLENRIDYDTPYVYNTLKVTSYAVRVVGGTVNIKKGIITNYSGGGVCCSGTEGTEGHITLGDSTTTKDDIVVFAAGERYVGAAGEDIEDEDNGTYDAVGQYVSTGWQAQKSISGGHAIELNGGNITVWNGTYTANFGNGIAANSNGVITVWNGEFDGKMTTTPNNSLFRDHSGPAAYYGLKVIGGAEVHIHGGNFMGGNGGAFVTGIDNFVNFNNYSSTTGKRAEVYVYGGNFGGDCYDSFNVYDHSYVVFGAAGEGEYNSANEYRNAIKMIANSATIATNQIVDNRGAENMRSKSIIDVYYGVYTSGNAGIYNSNADVNIYNYNQGYVTYTVTNGSVNRIDTAQAVYFEPQTTAP